MDPLINVVTSFVYDCGKLVELMIHFFGYACDAIVVVSHHEVSIISFAFPINVCSQDQVIYEELERTIN